MHNPDVALASAAGIGTSVALTASQVPTPDNLWSFLSLIPAIVGPALAVWMNRYLSSIAARKKAKAQFLEAEAVALLKDDNKDNDKQARDLQLEAVELKAEAEALNESGRITN